MSNWSFKFSQKKVSISRFFRKLALTLILHTGNFIIITSQFIRRVKGCFGYFRTIVSLPSSSSSLLLIYCLSTPTSFDMFFMALNAFQNIEHSLFPSYTSSPPAKLIFFLWLIFTRKKCKYSERWAFGKKRAMENE